MQGAAPPELGGLTVAKLRELCEKHGLPKTGVKADLLARLRAKLCSDGPPVKKQKIEVHPACQAQAACYYCTPLEHAPACAWHASSPAVRVRRQAPKSRSLAPMPSRHAEDPRHFCLAALGARLDGMRSACHVVQAIAQLAPMFPALPASAIADALGKAGGDVQHAANALFAEQVNV